MTIAIPVTSQPAVVEERQIQRRSAPRERSDEEIYGMVRRAMRALGGRLSQAGPDSWEFIQAMRAELRVLEARVVQGWRDSGWTDREIGEHIGVTQQAVQKRWPRVRGEN